MEKIDVFLFGLDEETLAMAQFLNASQSLYKVRGFIDLEDQNKLKQHTSHLVIGLTQKEIEKYRVRNILLLASQNINNKKYS